MQHEEPAETPDGGETSEDQASPTEQPSASPGSAPQLPLEGGGPASVGGLNIPQSSPLPRELSVDEGSESLNPIGAPLASDRDDGWRLQPGSSGGSDALAGGDIHRLHPGATSPPRTGDAILGLLIIVLSFAGSMLFSLWARDAALAPPAPAPGPPLTDLPGFPDQVRPLELLAAARKTSVRQLFQGFVADGISSDGTVDLSKKGNQIRYSFQDLKGRGPQPHRDGGTLPIRTYCGRQSVVVDDKGMRAKEDAPSVPCSRSEPRVLPLPTSCSIEDVWKVAKRYKFRLHKPARIEYFRSKGGPAYRLVQNNSKSNKLRLVVSARDCRSVLSGKRQRGVVP